MTVAQTWAMDTQTPQPAKPLKQRPIRFTTVEAFAEAYMALHNQNPEPQPGKSGS